MSNTPNRDIPYVPEGTLDPAAGLNEAIDVLDAIDSVTRVISMDLTEAPASGADGDLYIVGAGATGVWAGLDDYLVRYVQAGDFWKPYAPGTSVAVILNRADGQLYVYDEDASPASWSPISVASSIAVVDENASPADTEPAVSSLHIGDGLLVTPLGGGAVRLRADLSGVDATITVVDENDSPNETVSSVNEVHVGDGLQVINLGGGKVRIKAIDVVEPIVCIPIACSDETTDLATGNGVVTFRMPFKFALTAVRCSVTTAPTGSTLQVDINEAGASILSTKLTIDATEKTSTTAATPPVISDASMADDAEITIDIDQVGSTVKGKGLKVYLIGRRST